MIPVGEIRALRAEWQLRDDVIEKDYVLGWLLAGVATDPALSATWVFKGGTCLRKCYYETYRFSEDLDFTVVGGGPEEPSDLLPIFGRIGEWLVDQSGIALVLDGRSFVRRRNRRGNPTTQGRIAFRGPIRPPQLAKVRLDLTSDEIVVDTHCVGLSFILTATAPSRRRTGFCAIQSWISLPRRSALSLNAVGRGTSTT